MQRRYAGGLFSAEAQGLGQFGLFPASLSDGVQTARPAQHRTHRQGQYRRQGMTNPPGASRVCHLAQNFHLSRFIGATPTEAAICFRSRSPSSGRCASSVRESCSPTPFSSISATKPAFCPVPASSPNSCTRLRHHTTPAGRENLWGSSRMNHLARGLYHPSRPSDWTAKTGSGG